MSKVTTAMVAELRKTSYQGIVDCKNALEQADRDMDRAIDILQEKGLISFIKRNDKQTSEGQIFSIVNDNNRSTAMASLCCETDFVANSDVFQQAISEMKECLASTEAKNITDILDISSFLKISHDGVQIADIVADIISKTKENITIGDFAIYSSIPDGVTVRYLHFNKKVGTIIQLETKNSPNALNNKIVPIANDIAMHITATDPMAYDENDLPLDMIEKERRIFAEQIKDKPEDIKEKIIDEKMKKFYNRHCLIHQQFVNNSPKTTACQYKTCCLRNLRSLG